MEFSHFQEVFFALDLFWFQSSTRRKSNWFKKWKLITVFLFYLSSEVQKLSSLVLPSEVIIAQSSVPGKPFLLSVFSREMRVITSVFVILPLRSFFYWALKLQQNELNIPSCSSTCFIKCYHFICMNFLFTCVFVSSINGSMCSDLLVHFKINIK